MKMFLHGCNVGDSKVQAMNYEAQLPEQNEHKVLKDFATDLFMCAYSLGLTEWEKDFCFDMTNRRSFSPKQKAKIMALTEKYDL